MNTSVLKEKLHGFVEGSDERLLKMMFAIAQEYYNDSNENDFTIEEIQQFEQRRENRISGLSSIHTWEDAKEMIINRNPI